MMKVKMYDFGKLPDCTFLRSGDRVSSMELKIGINEKDVEVELEVETGANIIGDCVSLESGMATEGACVSMIVGEGVAALVGDGVMTPKTGETPKLIEVEGFHAALTVGDGVNTAVGRNVVNDGRAHQSVFDSSRPRHPVTGFFRPPFL